MSDKKLRVTAEDASADISVLDGSQTRVARGLGKLEAHLPAGLYNVRVRVGPSREEKLVSLDRDQQLHFDAMPFPSALPLEGTTNSHEYHMAAAVDASRRTAVHLGTGASIFVFVRDWTGPAGKEKPRRTGNPAAGLFLGTWAEPDNPSLECDIGAQARTHLHGDPSAGWCAEVSPGSYRLLLRQEGGATLERALYVSPGHQTQVFMLMTEQDGEDGEPRIVPDLASAALSISLAGEFRPDDRLARLAELARFALAQKRPMLGSRLRKQLFSDKFIDPTLGLYAAHILLRDRSPDEALFAVVIGNLGRMLGPDHPDILALSLRLPEQPTTRKLRYPPMLRASWDIACAHDALDEDSVAAELATQILPHSPWLTWAGGSGSAQRSDTLREIVAHFLDDRAKMSSKGEGSVVEAAYALKSSAQANTWLEHYKAPGGLAVPAAIAAAGAFLSHPVNRDAAPPINYERGTGTSEVVTEQRSEPSLRDRAAEMLGSGELEELAQTLGLPAAALDKLLGEY
jgi:hypothetical protein